MKKLGRKVTVGRSHAPNFTPPASRCRRRQQRQRPQEWNRARAHCAAHWWAGAHLHPRDYARAQQEGREKESTSCLAVLLAAGPPRCAAPASPSLWRWRPPVAVAVAVAEATRRPKKTSTSLSLILKLGASNSVNLNPLIILRFFHPGKKTST